MSRNLPTALGLILVALTLGLVAPAMQSAHADGTWVPIFEEEIVASIRVGDNTYVALPHQATDLETAYGGTATIGTLAAAIARAPEASMGGEFVLHGLEPMGSAVSSLASQGYDISNGVASSFPGVMDDMIYTD